MTVEDSEIPSVRDIRWTDECEDKDRKKAIKKAIEFLRKYKYIRQ